MSGPVASRESVAMAIHKDERLHAWGEPFPGGQCTEVCRETFRRRADVLLKAGVFRDEAIVKAEALEAEAARTYRKGGDDYPFAASEVAAFLNDRARRIRAGESS